ncbi:NADH dehydrogenase [Bacillus sp. FJAT-27916]|uniref:NAD(P)/FAD-dependent oxidoreductase n=1 Tax=Bacillus sp. FJAT-27916 TaxID=1679169 RepID=UPI000670CAA4|nr:NAD(P)/FAD-dependent oxidoreductase [Bacillus sp. FJAT-27916]KMY43296.1 NADH dehydrogenase [Bacillus sp. FJAT-27916]
MKKPQIVILGAGYGGLVTAVRLQKKLNVNEAEITLINKHNYHYETTWLHEASAGTLHHDRVRYEIPSVIDKSKVKLVEDTVVEVNKEAKTVVCENNKEIPYDYLVIALGAESETFGIEGLKEYAFSISSVNKARHIRDHIEHQFALYAQDKKEERLTIVVGGAGFTGIEFIGELANRVPGLCKEYDIDQKKVRIICVEAAPSALPGFDPELVSYAVARLEKKGVEFMIGTPIKGCTEEGIIVGKGEEETEMIPAGTVVWAAGVRGSSIIDKSGFENMRGRVKVEPTLLAPGHEDVFVIGDCSLVINEEINRPYPPTAQISMQQAEVCAKNIVALVRGGQLENFEYKPKGTVCSLGDDDAIGVVFGKKLKGTSASIMKKVIDNRALFMAGGLSLMLKKGKFKFL